MRSKEDTTVKSAFRSATPKASGVSGVLRRNLALKIVSLGIGIVLYAYVQQERNPTVSRAVLADVVYQNLPSGVDVTNDSPQIEINVTGPKLLVDRMKDRDIKAIVDFKGVVPKDPTVQLRVRYDKPTAFTEVNIENPQSFLKLALYKQKTRKLEVTPIYSKDAPPGRRYGDPVVRPSQVEVKGRSDVVDRVAKVFVNATPVEPMGSIDGDFTLSARDEDDNPVDGVTLNPDQVHVSVAQIDAPYEKTVTVSVTIADQAGVGYRIGSYTSTPNQVRISGTPSRVNSISTIDTEDVLVRNLTADKTQEVNLIIPPDIQVLNRNGRPISKVTVFIPILRTNTLPLPTENGIRP